MQVVTDVFVFVLLTALLTFVALRQDSHQSAWYNKTANHMVPCAMVAVTAGVILTAKSSQIMDALVLFPQ